MASTVPITGGCSLHPVKNTEEVFDKVVGLHQNFPIFYFPHFSICTFDKETPPLFLLPPIFTGQSTPLTKLPPIVFITPVFQSVSLTKIPPLFFYFSLIFHWTNYTLNKTFSLEGEEAENEGKNLSQKLGGT